MASIAARAALKEAGRALEAPGGSRGVNRAPHACYEGGRQLYASESSGWFGVVFAWERALSALFCSFRLT